MKLIWRSFMLLLCQMYLTSAYAQGAPDFTYRDDTTEITVLRGEHSLILANSSRSAELPEVIQKVYQISKSNSADKFIVLAKLNSYLSGVVVYNARTGSIDDFFYGFMPTVSPDGRWVAFLEFYPRQSDPETVCHRIYDVKAGSAGNRKHALDPGDVRFVGDAIYPYAIKSATTCPSLQNATASSASRFYWSTDSNRIVFAVSSDDDLRIVEARLSSSPEKWATFSKAINGACSSDCLTASLDNVRMEGSRIHFLLRRDGKPNVTTSLNESDLSPD